jgi:dolichyl-diphosphooligosaccharide--protein glycosyltransferase
MSDVREATASLLAERPELRPAVRRLLEVDAEPPWEFQDVPLDSGEFGEVVSAGLVEKRDGGYVVADRAAIEAAVAEFGDGSGGQRGDQEGRAEAATAGASETGSGGTAAGGGGANTAAGGQSADTGTDAGGVGRWPPSFGAPSLPGFGHVDRVAAGALVGLLLLTALVRTLLQYGAVFRRDHVVLAGNDPYLFLHWVREFLAGPMRAFDPGSLAAIPEVIVDHDLLLMIMAWWTAALVGGTASAAATVLAWYPVLAAVLVGSLLYLVALRVTGDRRIGLATVGLFALTPAVAFRTMIGFADHDALDFFLLAATVLAVLAILRRGAAQAGGARSSGTAGDTPSAGSVVARSLRAGALPAVGLGLAVAGQIVAWRGGPVLLLPLGLVVATVVVSTLRADDGGPVQVGAVLAPIAAGLALASVLTLAVHLGLGLLQPARAVTPVLLLGGTGLMAACAAGVHRLSLPLRPAVGGLVAGSLVVGVLGWLLVPPLAAGIDEFLAYMAQYTWSDIAETRSLFAAEGGLLFAPFLLLGFAFVLGLAGLVAASWLAARRHRQGWLVLACYGWFFLGMAVVQSRFAGQFALFNAVLGAAAFVHLAALVDVARPVAWGRAEAGGPGLGTGPGGSDTPARADGPGGSDGRTGGPGAGPAGSGDAPRARPAPLSVPDGGTLLSLGLLFLLVSSLGILQTGVKQSQLAIEDDSYEAATFVADFAADRGLTYPENYVFSDWGRNRFFNDVVSGESFSYQFAQDNFRSFLAANDSAAAYDGLRSSTGFVLTTRDDGAGLPPGSLYERLHEDYGSRMASAPAVEHFRAIYATEDGDLRVFQAVPGARVTGSGPANESVVASTTVTLPPAELAVTYEQRVRVDESGSFAFRTPYPGTYELGNRTVTVDEATVEAGSTVTVSGPVATS